jgi:peptidyl-prolyl cis-trans isomerase C
MKFSPFFLWHRDVRSVSENQIAQSRRHGMFRVRSLVSVIPVALGIAACKPESPKDSTAATPPSVPPSVAAESQAPSASPSPEKVETAAPAPAALPADTLDQILNGAKKVDLTLPEIVAVVEGQEIKKQELEQAFTTILAGQGMTPDLLPAAQKAEGYKMVLDELIVGRLLTKKAADVEVKEDQISARFDEIKGRFPSPEAFAAQLEKSGQTPEKLKTDIQDSLRKQQWVESQIKDTPKATDEEVEDFYKKNPQQFQSPEQVRASHILVMLAKDAAPELVSEKQKKAEDILVRVKGGEAFDKLAKELSEDPSAKENSGDLGFFPREQMVPEFSEAAFGMKKGDLSAPVRSQFGFHIIQVTDRKDAETVSLEKVKPQLMAFLNRQKHDTELRKLLKDVREKANVEVKLP